MPAPLPYKRTVWKYAKVDTQSIRNSIKKIEWKSRFIGLDSNEVTGVFTAKIHSILSSNIPNKVVKLNDKDALRMTAKVKTAIKRKNRVYRKFLQLGRQLEEWMKVKKVKRETSKLIFDAKERYYLRQGRKLSDPNNGINTYWFVLNRLMNKKSIPGIPPILENGIFVTNVATKAKILNNFFVQQCTETPTGSTIPNFLPRGNAFLANMVIDRCKVLQSIFAVDLNMAVIIFLFIL